MLEEALTAARPRTDKITVEQRTEFARRQGFGVQVMFDPSDYDQAIVGCVHRFGGPCLAYDFERMCEITVALNGGDVTSEEAWTNAFDYVYLNFVTKNKTSVVLPIVVREVDDRFAETDLGIEEEIFDLDARKWTIA